MQQLWNADCGYHTCGVVDLGLSPAGLIAGGAPELLSNAAVPA